jgi:hypothetical protein
MDSEFSNWQKVDNVLYGLFAVGCLVAFLRPSPNAGIYLLLCLTNLNLVRFRMQWREREMRKNTPRTENAASS